VAAVGFQGGGEGQAVARTRRKYIPVGSYKNIPVFERSENNF
jgi:hypothetical protein